MNLHLEAASNLSDFFFRFHFQGLKSLPRAENLLFLSIGGVLAPEPKLFVRKAAPFCFFAETNKFKVDKDKSILKYHVFTKTLLIFSIYTVLITSILL